MTLRLAVGCLVWIASAIAPPASQAQTVSPPLTPDAEEEEEVQELEEEVGDRDPTYLRTRASVRYDHRLLDGSASSDRVRLRFMYAFGPRQRFAVSFLEPLVQTETPTETARGSGDAELQFNATVVHRSRFRAGASIQATLQTSSAALLGPGTTTLKPSLEFAGVITSRLELTAAFAYKQSLHASRGISVKQFEPDFILNARVFDATWFLEWDSFYDYLPGRLAQTLKPGVSRAFGPGRRLVGAAYYAFALNDWARRSQYRFNAGIDMTWFPLKHR